MKTLLLYLKNTRFCERRKPTSIKVHLCITDKTKSLGHLDNIHIKMDTMLCMFLFTMDK